ncbi:hypothetical protein [Chryseobacterium sp. StRB126]
MSRAYGQVVMAFAAGCLIVYVIYDPDRFTFLFFTCRCSFI